MYKTLAKLIPPLAILITAGCSVSPTSTCSEASSPNGCLPSNAVDHPKVTQHMENRTWVKQTPERDYLSIGMSAEIPTQAGRIKYLGPNQDDALRSLAVKIWLIENAKYSIDATYYIFTPDPSGLAIIAALCNAVQRGVDVRLMVDSIGSFSPVHSELKALNRCAKNAGYITKNGIQTTTKARVQTVVFNAISKVFIRVNRRSHDKLLIIDGQVPSDTFVITGGRNVSLDYFGLTKDGLPDPTAFKDIELILRPPLRPQTSKHTIGDISEAYYHILFTHKGNKLITPLFTHTYTLNKAQKSLSELKQNPYFLKLFNSAENYLNSDYYNVNVKLAHELGNLEDDKVVEGYIDNQIKNPNSIVAQLSKISDLEQNIKTVRIISPYLFLAEYKEPTGKVLLDERKELYDWLAQDPERRIEIITNSVLTSDNFLAQAMIDMDTAPRMLLDEETVRIWRDHIDNNERDENFINSQAWQDAINNPQIQIYQVGLKDSTELGGETHYGKLHAKFIVADDTGFVGTTNLDYRSRLYNNEMGYFIKGEDSSEELVQHFNDLKSISYLWGSKEWLQMRETLRQGSGYKARTAKRQRKTYTRIILTGLKWQI